MKTGQNLLNEATQWVGCCSQPMRSWDLQMTRTLESTTSWYYIHVLWLFNINPGPNFPLFCIWPKALFTELSKPSLGLLQRTRLLQPLQPSITNSPQVINSNPQLCKATPIAPSNTRSPFPQVTPSHPPLQLQAQPQSQQSAWLPSVQMVRWVGRLWERHIEIETSIKYVKKISTFGIYYLRLPESNRRWKVGAWTCICSSGIVPTSILTSPIYQPRMPSLTATSKCMHPTVSQSWLSKACPSIHTCCARCT